MTWRHFIAGLLTSRETPPTRSPWVRLAVVGGVSLALQLAVVASAWPTIRATHWANFDIEDSKLYDGMAQMFHERGILFDGEPWSNSVRDRMPGYSLYLIFCGRLADVVGGAPGMWVTAGNMLMYALGCVLLCLLVSRLVDETSGAVAGLGLALAPGNLPYALAHMPDGMATAFWLASLVVLMKGLHERRPILAMVAGALQGLAGLARPLFVGYEVVTVVTVVLFLLPDVRTILRCVVLHGLALGLVLAPWLVRNWMVWNRVLLTPQIGNHLYFHVRPIVLEARGESVTEPNHPLISNVRDPRVPRTKAEWERRFGSSWDNLASRNAVLGALANEDIRANYGLYLRLRLANHPRLYTGTGTRAMASICDKQPEDPQLAGAQHTRDLAWLWSSAWWPYQLITWAILASVYLGALAGIFLAWRRGGYRFLAWALLNLAYMDVIVGAFGHTRYRFPMMPIFLALAAPAAHWIARRSMPAKSESPINPFPPPACPDASS